MSDQTEQQTQAGSEVPTQAGSDQIAVMQEAIRKLEKNNSKLRDELTRKNEQLADKEAEGQEALQEKLLRDGKATELVEVLRGTVGEKEAEIAELRKQISDQGQAFTQSQVENVALNAFAQAGAHTPKDLFALHREKLELKDGQVVGLVGGVQAPLDQFVESLRAPGSTQAYHFSGSGARGMSAQGSAATTTAGGKSWSSLSFTEQLAMQVADRENGTNEVARLKAAG